MIDAALIAAAGLGEGLQRCVGPVDVLRNGRLAPLNHLAAGAVREGTRRSAIASTAATLPPVMRSAAGDLRALVRGFRRAGDVRVVDRGRHSLVLQYHRRFERTGLRASRALGVPFVLRVEAFETREELSWGVDRPGFRHLTERTGEVPLFRAADLLLPVSREVDDQLEGLGIDRSRRLMLPNGVDIDGFVPGDPDPKLLDLLGARGRVVVGWIGGFRPFHGLEMIGQVAAGLLERVPGAVLCLVGSGPLKPALEDAQRDLPNLRVLPAVAHSEIPRWIHTFDVCLLLAGAGPFHYSPLKLREYMACGQAIVAPGVGEIPATVSHDDAVLVPPGDPAAVVQAVGDLAVDSARRDRIGMNARRAAERFESWSVRAAVLRRALDERGLLAGRGLRTTTSHA
jgi:glycosyltransferase involved in cell wall biosynthesis